MSAPAEAMSERQLQALVEEYCTARGLLYYHTWRSDHSVPGFPDLVIVGTGGIVYVELKSDAGKVSESQHAWHEALVHAGRCTVYVWKPEQWRDGTIQARLDALNADGVPGELNVVRWAIRTIRDERAKAAARRKYGHKAVAS